MQSIEQFIFYIFVEMYQILGDLGLVIIGFTLIIRFILLPLTAKQQKTQKQLQEIQPEMNRLKELHKDDKVMLQQAQMELYKKYNVNPLAGCLPFIVQMVVFFILYRVLIHFLGQTTVNGVEINPAFGWMDLSKPDPLYVLPIVAAATQFILGLMISPGAEVRDVIPNQSKDKATQAANKSEEATVDMAATMQKQMLFLMPVMTGVIALRFPSGLALYWITTTIFSIAQQWVISGPGGLYTYSVRAWQFLNRQSNQNTSISAVSSTEPATASLSAAMKKSSKKSSSSKKVTKKSGSPRRTTKKKQK